MYSASASAWFSFPLKMICTAPWERNGWYTLSNQKGAKEEEKERNTNRKTRVFVPWHPWQQPQLRARRSSHLLSSVWSSSRHTLLRKPGIHTHTHHLFDPFYSLKDVLNFMFKSKHSYKSKVHFSLRGCTKTTFKSWSYFFNLYSDNFIYILFNWTAQVKISKTSKDFQYHFDHTHLSGDDSYFRDSGLSKCIQQFGSVSDDASVLLSGTCWQQSH